MTGHRGPLWKAALIKSERSLKITCIFKCFAEDSQIAKFRADRTFESLGARNCSAGVLDATLSTNRYGEIDPDVRSISINGNRASKERFRCTGVLLVQLTSPQKHRSLKVIGVSFKPCLKTGDRLV